MKSTKKITVAFIAMLCVAVLVLGGYYLIVIRAGNSADVTGENATEVQKLLAKDLETKYPDTPVEVVKLYWRFNKCMYNTRLNDKEFEALLKQLRMLYDEELLSDEENSWDKMLAHFKSERDDYQKEEWNITNYAINTDKDVEYNKIDGKECATVYTYVMFKKKSTRTRTNEQFFCRKNDDGDWKIVGWQEDGSSNKEAEAD